MRWRGNRKSNNIQDLRHTRPSRLDGMGIGAGALRLLPMVFKFLGVKGTAILVIAVVGYSVMTGNLGLILGALGMQSPTPATQSSGPLQQSAAEKELAKFVSVILADTEQTWGSIYQQQGLRYQEPRLVLFRQAVQSACGMGQSAMGPFYCPADQKVYIDLSFYDQLKNRFNAPGDFAQAYVIAHEMGHHIQTLNGTSAKVHAAKQKLSKKEANKLSVLQELQADCYAGVWAYHAHHKRNMLEAGDLEEGLRAASAIGDDTLQKQSQGYVSPDSFTHGTSKQRVKWFKIGFDTGNVANCNTFSTL